MTGQIAYMKRTPTSSVPSLNKEIQRGEESGFACLIAKGRPRRSGGIHATLFAEQKPLERQSIELLLFAPRRP